MSISYEEEVRKLKNSSLEKLNFGCGDCPLEGWTNIDGGDGNIYSAPNADQITFTTDRHGHDWRCAIDPSKVESELGWNSPTNFEEGIQKTIEWYSDK